MAIEEASGSIFVDGFKSSALFELVQQTLAENGDELAKEVGGVFLVKVTKKGSKGEEKLSSWVIDVKNNSGYVWIAKPEDKGDTTIIITDDDAVKLLNGTLNVTYALATRGIKVHGDKRLAMKLQRLANNRQPLKAKL